MLLDMWIIVSFWVKRKAPGSAAYSDPSNRHGEKMTFVMRCAQNIICYAVRSQVADVDGASDPKGRWIGDAAKLEKLLHSVWHEQEVDDAPADGAEGADSGDSGDSNDEAGDDGDAPRRKKRRVEKVHREITDRTPCRLSKLMVSNGKQSHARWCQVCFKLAPKAPKGVNSKAWKKKHCAYIDVKFDRKCKLRMCPKCYASNWNHVTNGFAYAAKSHVCRV
jgi:hypothetical protein